MSFRLQRPPVTTRLAHYHLKVVKQKWAYENDGTVPMFDFRFVDEYCSATTCSTSVRLQCTNFLHTYIGSVLCWFISILPLQCFLTIPDYARSFFCFVRDNDGLYREARELQRKVMPNSIPTIVFRSAFCRSNDYLPILKIVGFHCVIYCF